MRIEEKTPTGTCQRIQDLNLLFMLRQKAASPDGDSDSQVL